MRKTILLVLLGASFGYPQPTSVRPVFSRIPFWEKGGPPPDLAEKFFVYLDYAAQDYVICYPDPSGDRRVEFRIEAQFAVAPTVEVSMKRDAGGMFTYDYAVRNGLEAKRPIREFALIAAVDDDSLAMRHPSWTSTLAPLAPRPPGPADGPTLRIRAGAGRIVSWRTVSGAIAVAQTGAGFQLQSRFLPGITTAFGSSAIPAALPANLPLEVLAQLEPVLAPEHNWKGLPTVGPKFNPAAGPSKDPVWIASDYLSGMENLRLQGAIGSSFVDELVTLVEAVRAGGQRVPFRYRSTPQSPIERQIGEAARLALSSE